MPSQVPPDSKLHQAVASGSLKVVVFDCDGVLFDSKCANVQFYNHVMNKFGHPPVREDQQEFIHMHPASESLKYLMGEGAALTAALEYCRIVDFRQFNAYLRCEPGLVSLLQSLKASYRIALATNRTVSTRQVLAHFLLDKYFDLVVTAADVQFPKPHPESMERILDAFGAAPCETLYVGDSPVDEAVATATSVFFAAYKNPNLRADMHLTHFRELSVLFFPEEKCGLV